MSRALCYRPRSRAGFTLIELLVVIAIIAILAAILFPVFAKAKDKARFARCTSNVRQIAAAMMMYTQDNDETLPRLFYGAPSERVTGGTAGYEMSWMRQIGSYVKNRDVWLCTSNPNKRFTYDGVTYVSYVANALSGPNPPIVHNGGTKLALVTNPSSTLLISEMWNHGHFGTIFQGGIGVFSTGQGLTAYHNGMGCYIFADWHVKAMRPSQTVNVAAGTSMWSMDNQLYPNVLCGSGPATYIDCIMAADKYWNSKN